MEEWQTNFEIQTALQLQLDHYIWITAPWYNKYADLGNKGQCNIAQGKPSPYNDQLWISIYKQFNFQGQDSQGCYVPS